MSLPTFNVTFLLNTTYRWQPQVTALPFTSISLSYTLTHLCVETTQTCVTYEKNLCFLYIYETSLHVRHKDMLCLRDECYLRLEKSVVWLPIIAYLQETNDCKKK